VSKRLKSHVVKEGSRFKTVKETTKVYLHKCTPDCFRPAHKPPPPGLRRVSLGYVYMSSDGGFYTPWGKDDWLPVDGMNFFQGPGGRLLRMFNPTVELHIHSPGGRTVAKAVTRKDVRADEEYHAREAAKKLKRKGHKLKEAQNFLGAQAAKEISHAPKRRPQPAGVGRGAPGRPRGPFSKEVVRLRDAGVTEKEIVERMLTWLREQGQPGSPRHRASIRKRVRRWLTPPKKKLAHK
jgi:hypothetical protein